MHVTETVAVARPPDEVYRTLTAPEARGPGAGWSEIRRAEDGYAGTLYASMGAIAIDFDCRFDVVEEAPGETVRVRGTGTSPRMGLTFDARFSVRGSNGSSAVDVDADVGVSGPLAGMGQRRLGEQARRLLAAYVAGQP